MNVSTMSKRFAATGAVTALAAGALVGLGTTAAQATGGATITNTYTCTTPFGPFPATLDSSIPELSAVDTLFAGSTLPAGLAHVMNHFTISDEAYQQLTGVGTTKLGFPDFAGTIGNATLGADIADVPTSSITTNADGTHSFDANGTNKAAEMPVAGSYDVVSPASFTLVASTPDFGDVSVPCVVTPAGSEKSYGSLVIVKNDSTTTAKATKTSFAKGTAAKVKATVTGAKLAGNKVLLKKGSKTLDSATLTEAGKATLSTKKLPVGKNKLTVVYKSTGYNNGSKAPVTVKVVK